VFILTLASRNRAQIPACPWDKSLSDSFKPYGSSIYLNCAVDLIVCIQAKWPIRPELILVSEA